ncbi:MAG: nucleoside triphosphate pyrophosphohydrolase [Planctomycetota bacterium]|nr:nucleoside triphosphate pyrophosphohydrolase [Planctomycetota bacterium]
MTDPIPPTARPFDEPPRPGEPRLDGLARLVAVVDRLRAPEGGCPWDLKQTPESLTASLLEEAFEAVEAIEERRDADDPRALDGATASELGDLLMNLVLIARIEQDAGRQHLGEQANLVADKLIRRHPHVFGDAVVGDADDVLTSWEAIKKAERAEAEADDSAVAGVPKALPAIQRAARLGGKAMTAGFRWPDSRGALDKVREELGELEAAFGAGDEPDARRRDELEHELGDLLLATALFGRYAKVDPERALRSALRRFEQRFRAVEASFGGDLAGADLDQMMAAWERAKEAAR